MVESTDVTSIPPRGLTVEVLVAGLLFSVSAGLTGLSALSSQSPPSALLLLGWPSFAVVGGILLDREAGLRLGRTCAALSLAPAAVVVWSLVRWGDVESPDLAASAADLAAPLACAVSIALPWAFAAPARRSRPELPAVCALGAIGSALVVASRVAEWPASVQAAGWVCAGVGTLGTWIVATESVRRTDRASRRRMTWVVVIVAAGSVAVLAAWTLGPGRTGFYVTCGVLMIGSLLIANLWAAAGFRPLDEHLLDLGLVLGVAAASAVATGLVRLGTEIAHRPSSASSVVFTALLTGAMATPAALALRRSLLARRYGSGLIPPRDVAAITAGLHARTEPRDLLDKAARVVAAASGSAEVRIVLGDDDLSAPDGWVAHPLEVGGDPVGFLLIECADPEGLEARQQQVVAQLVPTVALVARAVGLAVEAEHARRDVARERDAERKRVMGDLHDGLGPVLAGMSMRVQAARRRAGSSEYAGLFNDLADELAVGRADLRRIVAGITPSTLDDGNLEGALQRLVGSFQSATDTPRLRLTLALSEDVVRPIQVAVYRSVAEGITNGLRHASASAIDVAVRTHGGRVLVEVSDDGVGGPIVPGVGLTSLARRAESLGGDLTVCPGHPGTTLRIDLPASEVTS